MTRRSKIVLMATAALMSVCIARAQAQAPEQWPTRAIHFVNPSAAGGGADILIRWLAARVQPLAGVPVVSNFRPADMIAGGQGAPSRTHAVSAAISSGVSFSLGGILRPS